MVPVRLVRPLPFVALVLATALLAAVAPSRPRAAGAAPASAGKSSRATGSLEARILALGEPVQGVAVQVRSTGVPGTDQWIESPDAVIDTSDAKGIVHFDGLEPGRYNVVGHCGRLPGNIATKVDVMTGKTAHTTLTLRRGGRVLGRAMLGDRGVSGVQIVTESSEALASSCPILEARNPGPDGRFSVGKVPVGTFVYVKAIKPLGRGDLEVWKDFNLAKPETVSVTWNFPVLDSAQLGTVRIGVRLDQGQPADRGRVEIQHIDSDWRYRLGFDFTQDDSITVLPSLPPGHYTVRAMATPGVKTWWNAAADTFMVGPGVKRDKIIPAKIRT
jgi:hypothetical protein